MDLSMIDQSIDSFSLGEYVRVISKPHNVDEYFICSSITLDLDNPGNDTYYIGRAYDKLTGRQVADLADLNAGINKSYEAAQLADGKATDALGAATSAVEDAFEALDKAQEATQKAGEAKGVAEEASQAAQGAKETADDAYNLASGMQEEVTQASQAAETARIAAEYAEAEAKRLDIEVKTADQLALDARLAALTAEARAPSTSKVWRTEPEPPYEAGDLWLLNDDGIVMICINAREASEVFDLADWRQADGLASQQALSALASSTNDRFSATTNAILSEVADTYALESDFRTVEADLRSQLVQTSEDITFVFDHTVNVTDTLNNDLSDEVLKRETFMRFSGNGIDVGREDTSAHPLTAHMDNIKIVFADTGAPVASLSTTGLHAPKVEADTSLAIGIGSWGSYLLEQMATNGNFSLRYRGA